MAEHIRVKIAQPDVKNHLQVKISPASTELLTARDKLLLTSRNKIFNARINEQSSAKSRLYAKVKTNGVKVNLAGKTWIANQSLTLPEIERHYNIDFYYYGTDAKAKRTSPTFNVSSTGINYGASSDYSLYSAYTTTWADKFCDVISITGGKDASSENLSAFLEANGSLVDTIEDLSGTTWQMLPSNQIQPFSDDETALYALNTITTTDKFQTSGTYMLYYGKSMYLPVTYSNGSVDLANGTNIWSDNTNNSNWWYRRSDMDAQEYKNLGMRPVVQITGGNSATVLRVINYFQKNAILFDGEFIEAGTYKWANMPDLVSLYESDNTIYVLNFTSDWADETNNKQYTNKEFVGINIRLTNGIYFVYYVDPDGKLCYAGYISSNRVWDGRTSNPVIALKSPVSREFKAWFTANTTKV